MFGLWELSNLANRAGSAEVCYRQNQVGDAAASMDAIGYAQSLALYSGYALSHLVSSASHGVHNLRLLTLGVGPIGYATRRQTHH